MELEGTQFTKQTEMNTEREKWSIPQDQLHVPNTQMCICREQESMLDALNKTDIPSQR